MQPANRILFQGHTTHSSPTLELALPPQQAAQGFFSPRASQVAQLVKNLPAMQETWAQPLGWEDSLKEGMATHSSILAWRIPTDREAWWATDQGVIKSRTLLSD